MRTNLEIFINSTSTNLGFGDALTRMSGDSFWQIRVVSCNLLLFTIVTKGTRWCTYYTVQVKSIKTLLTLYYSGGVFFLLFTLLLD